MTPEETKAAAQVMLAAEYDKDGDCQNIEFRARREQKWFPCWGKVVWNWPAVEYRIKPRPELKKGQIIEVSETELGEWVSPDDVRLCELPIRARFRDCDIRKWVECNLFGFMKQDDTTHPYLSEHGEWFKQCQVWRAKN